LKGNAMNIEIWSDVACPYCYIGKRHFERALESLPGRKNVEIEWKSFELNPDAQKQYEEDNYTILANKYGQTREWALQSANHMKEQGNAAGLAFDFDSLITTNTFDAHRLTHLAKSHGLQDEAEEALFEAHLVNGENVSDHATLMKIGGKIGLEDKDIRTLLDSDQFAGEVREDEMLSQQLGIQGVPYFVVNRKYAISGAQPIEHFVEVLKSVELDGFGDAVVQDENGNSCDMDGC
jgi:predicted DsbA family dithiol-disulfide isomerase